MPGAIEYAKHLPKSAQAQFANGKSIKTKMKKDKVNKILSTIISAITVVIIVFSLFLIIISTNAKKKGEVPQIFGKMFFIVLTDSMTPEINPGDLIYVSKTSPEDVNKGDYIVFYSQEPKYKGMLIVHMVDEVSTSGDARLFYTKGINALARDEHPTSQVLGIYKGKLKLVGGVLKAFQNKASIMILFAIIVFLLVAASQIKKLTDQVNKIKLEKEAEQARIASGVGDNGATVGQELTGQEELTELESPKIQEEDKDNKPTEVTLEQ